MQVCRLVCTCTGRFPTDITPQAHSPPPPICLALKRRGKKKGKKTPKTPTTVIQFFFKNKTKWRTGMATVIANLLCTYSRITTQWSMCGPALTLVNQLTFIVHERCHGHQYKGELTDSNHKMTSPMFHALMSCSEYEDI